MRRRELIFGVAGCLLAATASRAQQAPVPVVGFLHSRSPGPTDRTLAAFREGLADAGFIEGRNVALEFRWAEGHYDRLPALAADLVRRKVAVIAAPNLPSAQAARKATAEIPIVFLLGDDPIKQGFVASLNRPGGNATGISMLAAGLVAKRLGLLRELVPKASRIALLINPNNPNADTQSAEMQDASRAIGQKVEIRKATNEQEIEGAFASFAEGGVGGLVVGPDPYFNSRRQQIVALASRYALPAIYEWREFVDVGGLASYGANLFELYRELGAYAGRVLGGARVFELPVVQPTRFEFVINLKTAGALGLAVPQIVLAQADDVIE